MPLPPRFAPPGVPSHVWCGGNQKQTVFFNDHDRRRYLDLLARHCDEHDVAILAFCLMANHVHLVLQPSTTDGLTRAMMHLSSEYAQVIQFRLGRGGHLWRGRFRSAALDRVHLWAVFRYLEMNPVRTTLVTAPGEWGRSSAGPHLGLTQWPAWLAREPFSLRYTAAEWRGLLRHALDRKVAARIRAATRGNRPLAREEQITAWEVEFGIRLRPRKNGRPSKPVPWAAQPISQAQNKNLAHGA
jgi:putative transposase